MYHNQSEGSSEQSLGLSELELLRAETGIDMMR